jgi:hypothetical protein
MINDPITSIQRKAARVAGLSFLLAITTVIVVNYGINFRLILPGNVVDTARHIKDNDTLFRLNIACNIAYCATLIVLLSSLYVVLKNVNQHLALIASFCRLILVVTWCITALKSLEAIRFLGDKSYLSVFDKEKLQTFAMLDLASGYDAYYIGLPFWAIASSISSYLFFRSKYIPKALALYGIISSIWGLCCAFTFMVYPHFSATVNAGWFDMPMVIFEIALGVWLLFKGLKKIDIADAKKEN